MPGGAHLLQPDLVERKAPVADRGTAVLSRNDLFVALFFLGFINGISERVAVAVAENGITAALIGTFDISIIVWGAFAIGVAYLLREPSASPGRADWIVAAVTFAGFMVPVVPLSWLAISGLASHVLRTSERASFTHRGAWILLALTIPMFWGRLLFATFSDVILRADATLVGWLVGTHRLGNAVEFADGSGYLWIAPACSSLANVSLAILCWVTISKVLNRAGSWGDAAWISLACIAVIAINVTRISLIGLHREQFELIHGPVGATITSWAILGATVGICLLGVRRDLPARS
ncbi:hypothetical protein [Microvirga flavescens]|uniref:hypothetical protein n=1 Tax=Microvirga flavescens TaxID=2249811 RepID=UPI000DD81408|nr:hypothetical protein [Microvirga flavescens]